MTNIQQPYNQSNKPLPTLTSGLLVGLSFALVGALFTARNLAISTLPHILRFGDYFSFKEVIDGLPLPRSMDWNLNLINFLVCLREIRQPMVTLLGIAVAAALGWLTINLISSPNPTPEPDSSPNPTPEPVASPEPSEAAPPTESDSQTPETQTSAETITSRIKLWKLLMVAVLIAVLVRLAVPVIPESTIMYYRTMGTFQPRFFFEIATAALLTSLGFWFAGGTLVTFVGSLRSHRRASWLLIPLGIAGIAAGVVGQTSLMPRKIVENRDWSPEVMSREVVMMPGRPVMGVPNGIKAGAMLAKKAGIELNANLKPRSVVLMLNEGNFNVVQQPYTEDGLPTDRASEEKTRAFLKKRQYDSSLSWMAIKHLYNVATYDFDLTTAIEVCLNDMENSPHLAQCGMTTRAMLFTCAASPQNLALLDRWADSRNYLHPTRESHRLIGDLYRRFGQVDKAETWYSKAQMPRSFIERKRAEKPLFNKGIVRGTLLLNGKPLAGVKVGVVPRRMNGLSRDLEKQVFDAGRELLALRPFIVQNSASFEAYSPRPWAFRWVTAGQTTASDGKFELNYLTQGEYFLVFTLPEAHGLKPPQDPKLQIKHQAQTILVDYEHPSVDLGEIRVSIEK